MSTPKAERIRCGWVQSSPVTPCGRDTLSTFGEGKETAGSLERVEYTNGPNGEVQKADP